MIHFTCDRCKRTIETESELRYVVRLEVQATMQASVAEMNDDRDHLLELQDILERMEDEEDESISDDVYQRRHYDLCPSCYRKFIQNPLGREGLPQLNFSKN